MIINNDCIGCGICFDSCIKSAIEPDTNYRYKINKDKCINCGHCKDVCDNNSILED